MDGSDRRSAVVDANPTDDDRWMDHALALARRALGTTAPNPAVGCVLVRPMADGRACVVGRGWTGAGGRPHAETIALAQAGTAAAGATAYVTLEPCSHHGVTPPCADALIAAQVARVVVALKDPDPRVDGRGLARLEAAGIAVTLGARARAAARVNAGFLATRRLARPLMALKLAATLDGRIAAHGGASRWITGPLARAYAHRLRAEHDAVLVGGRTAVIDDPLLTCRTAGLADRSPIRIVLDRHLRLPLTAKLVATARQTPSWIVTLADGEAARVRALEDSGVAVIAVPPAESGEPDLTAVMAALVERGLTRVLVEGGGQTAALLLAQDLIDRIYWIRSAGVLGGDGVAAVAALGLDHPDRQIAFRRIAARPLGADALEILDREGGALDDVPTQ